MKEGDGILSPGHMLAMLAALPGCKLSTDELKTRVSDAHVEYAHAVTKRELVEQRLGQMKRLRQQVSDTARKLKRLTEGDDFAFATFRAGRPASYDPDMLADMIAWMADAEKAAPKRARGGTKDDALDALILALAGIYRDATGKPRPTSSRNVKRPEPHGPWVDFFFAAISKGAFGVPVQSQGKPITLDGFDLRWRRLVLRDQQSQKNSGAHNFQDAPESDTIASSQRKMTDAKHTGPNRRSNRGSRRAGLR